MTTLDIDTRMEMFKKYLDRSGMEHKQYQYDGVRWCLNNEIRPDPVWNIRGGLIADEMGLGKTIMMIGLMYCNFLPRTLIILPPILIDQWYAQIYKTTGHKALVYHGETKKTTDLATLCAAKIVIATYAAIMVSSENVKAKQYSLLHKVDWSRIIFDEAHHIRNSNTRKHYGARILTSRVRWLVSGTPIQNGKKDFYSLCSQCRIPASLYTKTENLSLILSNFILRRTKKQVGIHISDINNINNVVKWLSPKEKELAEELHSALSFSGISNIELQCGRLVNHFHQKGIFSVMLRARQSCIYPKLIMKNIPKNIDYSYYKEALDYNSKLTAVIDSIVERKGNGNGKLVFCHFRDEIDEIAGKLSEAGIDSIATFDGRTDNDLRSDILNEKKEVLILQIQTGCEGLNLQENYNEIYFVSPHWNPAVEDQAVARCHRIGQTKPVYVYRFEMDKFDGNDDEDEEIIDTVSIDKYIEEVQEAKRLEAKEIIDTVSIDKYIEEIVS